MSTFSAFTVDFLPLLLRELRNVETFVSKNKINKLNSFFSVALKCVETFGWRMIMSWARSRDRIQTKMPTRVHIYQCRTSSSESCKKMDTFVAFTRIISSCEMVSSLTCKWWKTNDRSNSRGCNGILLVNWVNRRWETNEKVTREKKP